MVGFAAVGELAVGQGPVAAGVGAQTLTGTLFSDGDSFGAGTLTTGPVTITGALYADGDTFGAGTVTQGGGLQAITGTLFADGDAFGAGALTVGAVTINGTLYADPDAFGAGSVSVVSPQTITGTLFEDGDTFGAGSVGVPADEFVGGGGGSYGGTRYSDPYKRDELKAEDRKRLRAVIEKAMRDDESPEAEKLQDIVEPAVEVRKASGQVVIDWPALMGRIDAVERAANVYIQALHDAEDDEDAIAMLLAA